MNKLPNHPLSSTTLQPSAVIFAIIVHLILLVLLWWGTTWVQPKPLEVELWDAASLSIALNDTQTVVPPAPVNETIPTVVTPKEVDEPADIETKYTPKANSTPTSAIKPESATAQKQSKPVENKPVAPSTKSATKPTNDNTRNTVLGGASKTGSTASSNKGNSGNNNADLGRLKSAIENAGRNRGLSGLNGNITIKVSPSGSISVVSISGLSADKQSILKQVASSVNVRGLSSDIFGQSISLRLTLK